MITGVDFRPQWYREQRHPLRRGHGRLLASSLLVVGLAAVLFQSYGTTSDEPAPFSVVTRDAMTVFAPSTVMDRVASRPIAEPQRIAVVEPVLQVDPPRIETGSASAPAAENNAVAQTAPAMVPMPAAQTTPLPVRLEVSGTTRPRSGVAWAYVNGRAVEVGEQISGWRVLQIASDAVVFENDAGHRRTERLGAQRRVSTKE